MRSPGNGVHGGVVELVFIDLSPHVLGALSVYEHRPVVGAGGKDRAEFGMCPGHLPDWTFVAGERSGIVIIFSANVKYFNSAIGGAGCKLLRIIIELRVVDHVFMLRVDRDYGGCHRTCKAAPSDCYATGYL